MIDFRRSVEGDSLLRQYARHRPFVFTELAYLEKGKPIFVTQLISLPHGYMRPLPPEPRWLYGESVKTRHQRFMGRLRAIGKAAGIPEMS